MTNIIGIKELYLNFRSYKWI